MKTTLKHWKRLNSVGMHESDVCNKQRFYESYIHEIDAKIVEMRIQVETEYNDALAKAKDDERDGIETYFED